MTSPAGPSTPPPPSGPGRVTTPLDPNSPKGREIAAQLTAVLADIEIEIAQRKARRASGMTSNARTDGPEMPTPLPQPPTRTSRSAA